jgi:hypothetical protein
MTQNNSGELPSPFAIMSFWQLALGSVLMGLSAFSLYVRMRQVGLYGVVHSIHEQYEWARDGLFKPILAAFPFLVIAPALKSAIVLISIIVAIGLRTALGAHRALGETFGSSATRVVIFFFMGFSALFYLFIPIGILWAYRADFFATFEIVPAIVAASLVFGTLLASAPIVGALRDRETFLIFQLGAANAAACIFWSLALLALNAASGPA